MALQTEYCGWGRGKARDQLLAATRLGQNLEFNLIGSPSRPSTCLTCICFLFCVVVLFF